MSAEPSLDFVVIGAQKSGTTSVYEYLRRHPELSLPAGKEAPYFSHDAVYSQSWDEYLRKAFPSADPHCKWGTVTPHYMVGGVYDAFMRTTNDVEYDEHTVPLRIRERLPSVRLIAILRDPARRALSHYRMSRLTGKEQRSFDQAIDDLLDPRALQDARRLPRNTTGYVAWGEYGRILGGYFDVFETEQILVLFLDDLQRDPESVLRTIYEFVGVSADFTPANVGMRYRVAGTARRAQWLNVHRVQQTSTKQPLARSLWHRLPPPARHRVDRAFNDVAYRLDLWNRRAAGEQIELSEPMARRLRAHFAPDTERLATLLGMNPPWASPSDLIE